MAQASSGLQLQRSAVSFRRQGSSGLVWSDRVLSGELARPTGKPEPKFLSGELARPTGKPEHKFLSGELARPNKGQRSGHRPHDRADVVGTSDVSVRPVRTVRSNGGRAGFESSEPPSPRVSGCGCCGGLGKSPRSGGNVRPVKPRTR